MSLLEITAVVFSFLCVVLAVRRNVWCWPVGIVGVLAYLILFYKVKLYADMGLQFVFLAQSVYGWVYWARKDEYGEELPIRALSWRARGVVVATIVAMTFGLGTMLEHSTDASLPYLDSLLASMSLFANGMQARKILDNWIIWITADVFFIGMFFYKGLLLSAGLYCIFLALSTRGFIKWYGDYKAIQARNGARQVLATA